MYRNILVPIDGSATATAGLREAIKLAKDQDARIRLVHVIDEVAAVSPHIYGFMLENLLQRMRTHAAAIIADARALVEAAGVAVDVKVMESLGVAGEYIIDAANDWPADIIVCGTHGRRGLRRAVMGSDAEFIVRRSPVPVLLVPARTGSGT